MNEHAIAKNQGVTEIALELFGDNPGWFRQHLVDLNLTDNTVRKYIRCIGSFAGIMKVEGIAIEDLDEAQAAALVAKTGRNRNRKTYATFIVRRFVRFLAEQGIGKPTLPPTAKEIARAELRRDYEIYLRRQRGRAESSIYHSWRIADRFLEFRFGEEARDLSQITSSDIAGFLLKLTTRTPPLRDRTLSWHLRSFFLYLFKVGKTPVNLAPSILRVAQRYGTRLPRHLTGGQVDILVRAVRTDTHKGRRNYAMVLLLARLGLRATEVVAMQIDDIDWRSGEIIVRGKGSRHDRVPLPPDVGEALAEYIRFDRKTTSRALFVTERSPHHPFKNGKVLNSILKNAFAITGLSPPAPCVGSHILRHSLATNLVQRGASLEEIGDMLRHRSRAVTLTYARLDIDGLRSIAQPWPVARGAK